MERSRNESWQQMKILCALAAGAACLFSSSGADAHLWLQEPPARHPADDLKYGPCGVGSPDQRSTDPNLITTYQPGETITVTWTETIDHDPSHFRVMFSESGDGQFTDPTGFDDQTTVYPELLDGIPDADAGANHVYSVQVTLPNITCETCTLQVIQVMHDKPPWGPGGGDDIYYQCADIVIAGDPVDPSGSGGAPGAGGSPTTSAGGSSTSSGGTSGPAPSGGSTSAEPSDASRDDGGGLGSNCQYGATRTGSLWPWALLALVCLRTPRRRWGPRH